MFELTDTLTYAVPVMLSVLVAKTVADAIEPKGIYDLVIELSQLPYLEAKHDYIWGSHVINDAVNIPYFLQTSFPKLTEKHRLIVMSTPSTSTGRTRSSRSETNYRSSSTPATRTAVSPSFGRITTRFVWLATSVRTSWSTH